MYLGGNHWATILMPMTKPAPTELSTRRAISICMNEPASTKAKAGRAMMTINPENTTRAPNLSMRAPTMIRAGIVSATLAISKILMCSSVSHPTESRMVVAIGAMLNHT